MKQKYIFLAVILIGLFYITVSSYEKDLGIKYLNTILKTQNSQSTGSLKPDLDFGKIPLYFITNQGQVNEKAKYYAKASRYTLWMTKEGLVFDSSRMKGNKKDKHVEPHLKSTEAVNYERDVSRLIFIGANQHPEMVPIDETKLKVNYFKGNDPAKWHCDIPTSKTVLYNGLYKNIQLKVYGVEKQVEYDWIVEPNGNPGDIRFKYKNVKGTRIDKDGNLLIETDFGEMMHKRPVSYQKIRKENSTVSRVKVKVEFKKIGENSYGFDVGEYDKNYELIIDPVVLVYSTYLGGSGWDIGDGIAVDSKGKVYVTGRPRSTDFPTLDQYQTYQGGYDVSVTKIDTTQSAASSLIYSTCLGGCKNDWGSSIAVDSSGCAYVTGGTYSPDFPILDQYQTYQGGVDMTDAFMTKIDTTKSGASSLIYSTYLGGGSSDSGSGIVVDLSGYTYVTGETYSTDFPTLNQYQTKKGINYDVFVTKIDTSRIGASSLIYSTFLGGLYNDIGLAIAVDNNSNAYVTGYTGSPDFPILNQYQKYQGWDDTFVAKIDTTRSGVSSLIYSTYLGGSGNDRGYGIAVDSSGNVYVIGDTESTNFPTLNQYQSYQGSADTFVAKIDTTRSGTSGLIYSTYLGGSDSERGSGIAVDSSGNVYVTGKTESTDFPTKNQYQDNQPYIDAFVTKIDASKTGTSSLIYSTYLGGGNNDWGSSIAVDNSGQVYVTGGTYSSYFPVLNQYQTYQGDGDAFVTKLCFEILPPKISLNRTQINFGTIASGATTSSQIIYINNSGDGTLNWSVSDDVSWLNCFPSSGTNAGSVTVSVEVTGLLAGTYTGTITVSDPNASNSPQTVSVTLKVYAPGQSSVPFGPFATPLDGSTVSSSIPVTGWALDDIGVESVKIYRGNTGSLVYIGDAVFVEGARTDVEQAYPDYPMNYKAGWGYMMLTNFLPNGGNGTFKIHAIAADVEGHQVTLGTKKIIVDNTNAVKPFGAIDTPSQGGTASGSNFINWGWVLTPQPSHIAIGGSTINVYVNGVNLGHPNYNIYRSDIAALFPGYANSNGAAGYFYLDTTAYANGVHTIQWTAKDSTGNTDGIGSRYFTIQNPGSSSIKSMTNPIAFDINQVIALPIDNTEPCGIVKGFNKVKSLDIAPDRRGLYRVEIEELERIKIILASESNIIAGWVVSNDKLYSLPIGSTLRGGSFYWAPGPGFLGDFMLIFVLENQPGELTRREILVNIVPRR